MRRADLVMALTALGLGVCAFGGPSLASSIATAPDRPSSEAERPAAAWWKMFGDPVLDALQDRLQRDNPELAAAGARYEQALALLGGSRAETAPQIQAGAQIERSRVSRDRPLSSGRAATYDDLRLGAALSYELDLFGRLREGVRASQSQALAAKADVEAVRLGLQAQLTSAYFQMREYDARIALLDETVRAYGRAYELTEARHAGGIASGMDVSRARTQAATAAAERDAAIAARARAEHAVAVLIGQPPGDFRLASNGKLGDAPAPPQTLPSTLLQRRPDIQAAQHRVTAANARIGVARAAFFPSITLGAAGGYQATHDDLIRRPNSYWSLGPIALSLPLFDGGARRADLRLARAEHEEASAAYRRVTLAAFQEVQDDLVTARQLAQQIRDQDIAAASAARTRDLALDRYRDGAADYLEVATAQTAALDAQRAVLSLRAQALALAADTVRALGGAPE